MKTALLGWDIGKGIGHVMSLLPLGASLSRRGFRVVFAARRSELRRHTKEVILSHLPSIQIEEIPDPPPCPPIVDRTNTIIDVLCYHGFCDYPTLFARAKLWNDLVNRLRPDIVVADFAPCLTLVCQSRIPVIAVGTGFAIPPAGSSLPAMAPWLTKQAEVAERAEHNILISACQVASAIGIVPPNTVADLLRGNAAFAFTHPTFDPYRRSRAGETTYMPYNIELPNEYVEIRERPRDKVFGYLRATHNHLPVVLSALQQLDVDSEIFVPDGREKTIGRIQITDRPFAMSKTLSEARLLIHHAGLGITHAGLLSGTPQLTLPVALEHLVTARGLQPFGIAACLPEQRAGHVQWFQDVITALLVEADVAEASRRNASQLMKYKKLASNAQHQVIKSCTEFC